MNADITFLKVIVGLALLFVAYDWFKIEIRKKDINHRKSWTARAFLCVVASIFISDTSIDIVENLVASIGIVWFVFQYGLNLARGKRFMYINPRGASVIDRTLVRIFKSPLAIFMFLGFLCTLGFWLKIYGFECIMYGCY